MLRQEQPNMRDFALSCTCSRWPEINLHGRNAFCCRQFELAAFATIASPCECQAPYAPRVLIAAARRAELTHALQMPLTTLSTAVSKPKAHTDSWIDIAVLEKAEG